MSKWQRSYTITIQGRSGRVYTFTDPLTCVLDIDLRATSSVNPAHFQLLNLSPQVLADLEYDSAIDTDGKGQLVQRPVVFNAGYVSEGVQPVVFQGDVTRAFNYRDGTDVVTDIACVSGLTAMQKALVQRARAAPWTPQSEVEAIVATMNPYGVTLGAVGGLFAGYAPTRGVNWIGSSWDCVRRFANGHGGDAFIHLNKVYVMGPNDALNVPSAVPQLDATTGLLGTPRRAGWNVDARMMFEPRVQLLQQIRLLSSVSPSLNGTYVVWGISHRGIISGARDGGAETSLFLQQNTIPGVKAGVLVTPP